MSVPLPTHLYVLYASRVTQPQTGSVQQLLVVTVSFSTKPAVVVCVLGEPTLQVAVVRSVLIPTATPVPAQFALNVGRGTIQLVLPA